MKKFLVMIAALAMLALPSAAIAQPDETGPGGIAVQQGEVRGGGTLAQQQAQNNCQPNSECSIDQSQRVNTTNVNRFNRFGVGGGRVHGHGHHGGHVGHGGVGGGNVTSFGHGGGHGGGVGGVTLARTGADAWILALVGGVALAGGLGLLAAQRRGRLNA